MDCFNLVCWFCYLAAGTLGMILFSGLFVAKSTKSDRTPLYYQPSLYVPGPNTIRVFLLICFYCALEHGRVQMPQPPAVDLFGQTLARSFPLRFQLPLSYPTFYTLSWISFQQLVSVLFSCSSKLSWKSSLTVRI